MPKVILFYNDTVGQYTQIAIIRKKNIPFFGYNKTSNGFVRAISDNFIDLILLTDEGDYIPAGKDISNLSTYSITKSNDELRLDTDLIKLIEAKGSDNNTGCVVEVEKGRAFFISWNEDNYGEDIVYQDSLKWFSL